MLSVLDLVREKTSRTDPSFGTAPACCGDRSQQNGLIHFKALLNTWDIVEYRIYESTVVTTLRNNDRCQNKETERQRQESGKNFNFLKIYQTF